MKKALSNTKVTVKLRKSVYHDNEWFHRVVPCV